MDILKQKLTEFDLIIKSNQFQAIYVMQNQNPSFRGALQNFKIVVDIAIENTLSHADCIHWAI
jgi:hypothetical protein